MRFQILVGIAILFFSFNATSQVVLAADGPGNTYELINSVLAKSGRDVVETPDCGHTAFGKHIDEIFDADLNKNVFRFSIHVTPDNDRCNGSTDRQRNEIKTYSDSPGNLLGIEGEKVIYKWKMKIPVGFQPSSSFTHLHQLKSVGGPFDNIPMYTLTARKGNPNRLELRYAETNNQTTLDKINLSLLEGNWIEFIEKVEYGKNVLYSLEMKRVDNGTTIFKYEDKKTVNWQQDAEFVRPKWGIYRSLNNKQDLRDEQVLFADFSIEETNTLSLEDLKQNTQIIKTVPNPTSGKIYVITKFDNSYDAVLIYDVLGKLIDKKNKTSNDSLDISNLKIGSYYFIFKKDDDIVSKNTVLIN